MENASKALIMAGGILIGILIISLGVYLFADFGTTSAEIHKQNDEKQLTQFNTQFTTYLGRNNITPYELVSVINLAKENNNQYKEVNNFAFESNGYQIQVNVDKVKKVENLDLGTLEEKYINEGANKLYTCTNIEYDNQNGRVRLVEFETT